MSTVLIDVDTQLDFMFPAGALYVPGAEKVLPAIARLNTYAGSRGIPLISTTDAHTENDPEFRKWPAHCVEGTIGQTKPQATLLPSRAVVPVKAGGTLPVESPQIIVQKTVNDVFSNPNFPALLDALGPKRYVVYGVVTEICVRCAVFGLLKRGGARIELVTDAVQSLSRADADAMYSEFTGLGGVLTSADAVAAG